jgi:uncharacterized membrane protein YjjP (DUF1212 family)
VEAESGVVKEASRLPVDSAQTAQFLMYAVGIGGFGSMFVTLAGGGFLAYALIIGIPLSLVVFSFMTNYHAKERIRLRKVGTGPLIGPSFLR